MTTAVDTKPLIAFHGDPAIKQTYLDRVEAHRIADQIIQGTGWDENSHRGCAVGCTLHDYNHLSYETELGIPFVLAHLEDAIFEALPIELASRSAGDRLLSSEELSTLPHEKLFKLWRDRSTGQVYDFKEHVAIAEELDHLQRLPATFMLFPPHSWHPDVWTDITRMRTLNGAQHAKGKEMHLCLARGSMILTRQRGYVAIQDVSVGEEVLTHKGRWRPVTVARSTGVRPVVTVKAQGVSLTLTPDHKVWTRAVRDIAWARSHSRKDASVATPEWIPAAELAGSYINSKLPPEESISTASDLHWWIVGRWLADGHISNRRGAIISCGDHETEGLVARLGTYGGNKPSKTGTGAQILLRDRGGTLRSTLSKCGHGAAGKHLPPEAFTLPRQQSTALLEGYLSGDGHYLKGRNRWTASSLSKELLLGLALVVQRVHGAIASIYPGRKGGPSKIQVHPQVETAGPSVVLCRGCIVKNCPMQFDIAERVGTGRWRCVPPVSKSFRYRSRVSIPAAS